MKIELNEKTKTMRVTLSRAEQIDLNNAELPNDTGKEGRKLKTQISEARKQFIETGIYPVFVQVSVVR